MLHVLPSNDLKTADPSLTAEKGDATITLEAHQTPSLPPTPQTPATMPDYLENKLDFSKPVSDLLKEGTEALHTAIGNLEGAKLFTGGELSTREYTRILFMLWHIYEELERGLYEHREHPVIFHIYHPRVFSRASSLSFDICHHLKTVTWQTDPFYVEFYHNIPKPIQDYVDRLAYLGRPEASHQDVVALAAHAYVRYLGDLSGGQIIKRRIIKAYGLYEDGDGLAFYNFRTLDYRTGDKQAEMHEIRRIKNWFKDGLNEAVKDTNTKELLVAEANAAFLHNASIFSVIDFTQTLEKEKALIESQSHPITKVLDKFTASTSVGTVAAVILAACGVRALWALNSGGLFFLGGSGGVEKGQV